MRISDWSSDVCSSDLTWAQCSRESGSPELAAKRLATLGSRLRGNTRKRDPMSVRAGLVDALLFLLREKNGPSTSSEPAPDLIREIRRASCRERVCTYV